MYFGLINYSIQKGIVIYKKDKIDKYSKLMLLKTNQDRENEYSINDTAFEDEKLKIYADGKNRRMNSTILFGGTLNDENIYELINDQNYKVQLEKIAKDSSKKDKSNSVNYKVKKRDKNKNLNPNSTKEYSNTDTINDNELDDLVKEKPFLIFPTKILNFHRENADKWCLKIIIGFIIIILISYIILHSVFLKYYKKPVIADNNYSQYLEDIAFDNIITNYPLNIVYSLDIELVVFLINWIFLIIYLRASKKSDVFDFMNNIYWSFFTKSYFSFMLISSPIIIYIFYQSESIITLNFSSTLLFSFINLTFILIINILFYSCFELPLKKIFKSIINSRLPNINPDLYEHEEKLINTAEYKIF